MRILVTGAADGIGRAVCDRLARTRATDDVLKVLAVDIKADKTADVCDALRKAGAVAEPMIGDLSDPAFVEQAVKAAGQLLGGLDAVVSNAGVLDNSPLVELSVAAWDRAFAVNTRATWLLAKHASAMLAEAKGNIVATASISSIEPTPPHGAYSASKAALAMLVQQLAFELGPAGIRCNCVSPGTVQTGMSRTFYSDPANRAARAEKIPLRRIAVPDDIAAVISFLLSAEAAYITGENILVDGGLHTVLMPAVRGLQAMS